jgi:hypothetical protein
MRSVTGIGVTTVAAVVGLAGAAALLAGSAAAELFVLDDGTELEGRMLDATRNTYTIWREGGGPMQAPRDRVRKVRIATDGAAAIEGELVDWADGVYQIVTGDKQLAVRADGTVLESSEAIVIEAVPAVARAAPNPPEPKPKQPQVVELSGRSPSFVLDDDSLITGDIVAQAGQTVVVRLPLAGLRQVAMNSIRSVIVPLDDGGELEGDLERWARGIYRLQVEGETVLIHDPSAILAADQAGQPLDAPEPEPAAAPVPVAPAKPAAAAPEEPTSETSSAAEPAQVNGAAEPDQPAPAPAPAAAEAEAPDELVVALAKPDQELPVVAAELVPATEGDAALVVAFTLSEAADKPVLIAYGSVNGTATAGVDYEQQRGVITIEPGQQRAELRIPLIDDSASDGEKDFTLFLSTSPGVATLTEKRLRAVIADND